jgi:Putative prokaryotic signal transducing protein
VKAVRTARTEIEAALIEGILEGAGIPVALSPQGNLPYGEAVDRFWGWGEILVPDNKVEEARELIAGYLSSARDESTP